MVLIILPSLRSGGTEWQVLSLIREMVSRVNVVLWVYDSKNNESDLRSMMLDPRYHSIRDRDPSYVKTIEDGFKKLYG